MGEKRDEKEDHKGRKTYIRSRSSRRKHTSSRSHCKRSRSHSEYRTKSRARSRSRSLSHTRSRSRSRSKSRKESSRRRRHGKSSSRRERSSQSSRHSSRKKRRHRSRSYSDHRSHSHSRSRKERDDRSKHRKYSDDEEKKKKDRGTSKDLKQLDDAWSGEQEGLASNDEAETSAAVTGQPQYSSCAPQNKVEPFTGSVKTSVVSSPKKKLPAVSSSPEKKKMVISDKSDLNSSTKGHDISVFTVLQGNIGQPGHTSNGTDTNTSAPSSNKVNVSSIKMDIMKALAEARSTIAGIKKVVAPKEGNNEASETKLVSQETKSHSPKKRAGSPTKKTVKNADVDEFDMFSIDERIPSAAGPEPSAVTVQLKGMIVAQQANCDDADGYYNTTVGEILNGRYRVLGVVGKGVFSTVLRCQRLGEGGVASPFDTPEVTAVKLIRSNDTMRDASQIEVRILKELAEKDPRDKKHCVRLLDTFEHRNHVALVFEPMQMNLREAMRKFGGKGGISLNAVQIFCKHLLIALNHLESCKVVHADIKPDNILLDDKQSMLKICDFGSAFKLNEGKHDPTPYLVSRYYRAPEIVLGLAYDHAVDMWSLGCCLYEMFTGQVMFPGSTNNEMLKFFMELKGKIPNKLIKKHRLAYIEQFQMEPHFTEDFKFCSRERDRVTGKPILRLMDVIKTKTNLNSSLMAAKSSTDDRKQVLELRNLLEKMFTLDPSKRIAVKEALAHPFVTGS